MSTIQSTVLQSITRPANATPYSAGDALSADTDDAHYTFGCATAGTIRQVILHSSQAAETAPDLELWLFDTDVATTADNDAFSPTDAEMLTIIGMVSFPNASWIAGGGGNSAIIVQPDIAYMLRSANLYGQLVARSAYTPESGEVLSAQLVIEVMA